ncbi:MAG: MarR family winged helix-turn-helix transcriptional regulator [Streptosporangiaceae bacterium]
MNPASDRLHDLLMDLVRLASVLHPDQTTPRHSTPPTQAFALHELDTDAPLAQRDLARRLRLEKSTVSRLVAEMEHEGLLVRDRDPGNRRYYRLRLTDHGRAAHARMTAEFHGRYVRLLSGMTATEREALLTGLPALVRVLRNELSREE